MRHIRKATVNFVVEGFTLLALLSLVTTGLMMEFRMPSGSGGRGMGGALTQLGLNRHDWGAIHFYIALGFLALIVLHLFLHWRWIWGLVRGSHSPRAAQRVAAFALATAAILFMAALPWLIPVKRIPGAGLHASTVDNRQE